MINEAEDEIDWETRHAWRTVTVTDEIYDYDGFCSKLKLQHRTITTFSSETDKLEVADDHTTGSWKDYIADYDESTTIGDSNDFYVDYADGIIYFKNQRPSRGKERIKMTYRYGESSVHKDIKKACKLLVAAELAETDRFYKIFPQPGEDATTLDTLANKWRSRAYKLLVKHKEPNIDHRIKLTVRR